MPRPSNDPLRVAAHDCLVRADAVRSTGDAAAIADRHDSVDSLDGESRASDDSVRHADRTGTSDVSADDTALIADAKVSTSVIMAAPNPPAAHATERESTKDEATGATKTEQATPTTGTDDAASQDADGSRPSARADGNAVDSESTSISAFPIVVGIAAEAMAANAAQSGSAEASKVEQTSLLGVPNRSSEDGGSDALLDEVSQSDLSAIADGGAVRAGEAAASSIADGLFEDSIGEDRSGARDRPSFESGSSVAEAVDSQAADAAGPSDSAASASNLVQSSRSRAGNAAKWDRIGRFEVNGQIGSGAFGFVYQGRDVELDRKVAIKIARVEVARHEPLRRLFEQEAEQAGRLDHPGIVPVYELGLTDPRQDPEQFSRPYIVMSFCHGQTLDQWMKKYKAETGENLPPGLAAELARQVAAAVGHGHRNGVSHRDVKPGNVMVLDDGPAMTLDGVPTLRVMDFGLAGDLDQLTQQNGQRLVAGSAAYMSPEQARGESVGPTSDVHALGAVLFKMLTGRTPFSKGDGRTRLLDRLSRTTAPSPRQIDPGVPEDLAAICLKCLRKNPDERYADAAELAEDLRRYLAGQTVRARTLTPLQEFTRWTALPDRVREAGAIMLGIHLFLPVWSIGGEVGVYLVDRTDTTTTAEFLSMLTYLIGITWPLHLAYFAVAWRMFHGRPVRWAMRLAAGFALVVLSMHFLRGTGHLPSPSPYYAENPGTRWQVFWMLSMTAAMDFVCLLAGLRAMRRTQKETVDRSVIAAHYDEDRSSVDTASSGIRSSTSVLSSPRGSSDSSVTKR